MFTTSTLDRSNATRHLPKYLSNLNFLVRVAGRLFRHSFMRSCLPIALLLASFAHGVALPGIRDHWSDPYSLRPNPLYPYSARSPTARPPINISTYDSRFWKDSSHDVPPSRTRRFTTKTKKFRAAALRLQARQDASTPSGQYLDTRPTPDPTGVPSLQTTVHITNDKDFALLLPKTPGGMFLSLCTGYEVPAAIKQFFCQNSCPTQKWMR